MLFEPGKAGMLLTGPSFLVAVGKVTQNPAEVPLSGPRKRID